MINGDGVGSRSRHGQAGDGYRHFRLYPETREFPTPCKKTLLVVWINSDGYVALGGADIAYGNFETRFGAGRSEEHTSELQSLMRISYAVFCLKTKKHDKAYIQINNQ